jgi:hypothetical protein
MRLWLATSPVWVPGPSTSPSELTQGITTVIVSHVSERGLST